MLMMYCPNLDTFLKIDTDERFHTKIYYKPDDFNFPIINFPCISSDIPSASLYRFYVSQLICYAHAYTEVSFKCKLPLQQSYGEERLNITLRKFYRHNNELFDL